jgi:hypothetical protein
MIAFIEQNQLGLVFAVVYLNFHKLDVSGFLENLKQLDVLPLSSLSQVICEDVSRRLVERQMPASLSLSLV